MAHVSTKSTPGSVQIDLPILEVLLQTKAEIEAFTAQAGLRGQLLDRAARIA